MSDDLISQIEAIDILENMIFEVGKDLSKSYLLQDARERIIRLNAAFDKEKVKEELIAGKFITADGNTIGKSVYMRIDRAVEIVEKGGIE